MFAGLNWIQLQLFETPPESLNLWFPQLFLPYNLFVEKEFLFAFLIKFPTIWILLLAFLLRHLTVFYLLYFHGWVIKNRVLSRLKFDYCRCSFIGGILYFQEEAHHIYFSLFYNVHSCGWPLPGSLILLGISACWYFVSPSLTSWKRSILGRDFPSFTI